MIVKWLGLLWYYPTHQSVNRGEWYKNKNCIDVKDQKHYSLEFDSTISDLRMIFLKFHCDNISAPLLPFHRKGFTFENITSLLLERRKSQFSSQNCIFALKNVNKFSLWIWSCNCQTICLQHHFVFFPRIVGTIVSTILLLHDNKILIKK